jgi:3,2-trans-enoyl-CoA isomerase
MLLSRVFKRHGMQLCRGIASSAVARCQASSGDGSQLVLIDINDKTGYATLSLNRPPANSFNLEQLLAFSKALDEMERNKIKGMILTSVRADLISPNL